MGKRPSGADALREGAQGKMGALPPSAGADSPGIFLANGNLNVPQSPCGARRGQELRALSDPARRSAREGL